MSNHFVFKEFLKISFVIAFFYKNDEDENKKRQPYFIILIKD